MAINGTHVMPNANNITVTTGLSSCDNTTFNLTQTVSDLRNLYISNSTSNVFSDISIINFNCTNGIENYFEQIITFTQSVSIRIQILFVSIYFDYINANNFRLNGFIIQRETNINLSSITTNNSVKSDACSSADAAQDPLCLINSTNAVCTILSNTWNYTCSQTLRTTIISLRDSTTSSSNVLPTAGISTGLHSWQLGLICGLSAFFLLLLIVLSGYFYRRSTHSKQLSLSHVNLYNDVNLLHKSGIPQGQAFQRAATVIQPKRNTHTAISWIHENTATKNGHNDENYINVKLPEPYNQVTFVDHAKVHDPAFSSEISKESIRPMNIPTSSSNRTVPKVISPKIISRFAPATPINQLKSINDELQEEKLNEYDNGPKNLSTPTSKRFTNLIFVDENLTDEDAWMCILEVVYAELALLDEQDRIRTLI